jgi:MFS family permease
MGIAVVVIANDFSAINVALPTMEGDFHTNINTIQWVVNAYALTFGVMIVTGGRLADMFGACSSGRCGHYRAASSGVLLDLGGQHPQPSRRPG